MNSNRSHFASVVSSYLAILAMLAAAVSTASADTMTYDIVDYPAAEIDQNNSGQDSVSGTITATATGLIGSSYIAGSFSPATDPENVSLSWSVTLSGPGGSQTYSGNDLLSDHLGSGTVEFTSSAILLNNGYLGLDSSTVGYAAQLIWRSDADFYLGLLRFASDQNPSISWNQSPATTLDNAGSAQNDSSSVWTVAVAAPEPAGLTLVVSALAGLGLFYSRRLSGRRAG